MTYALSFVHLTRPSDDSFGDDARRNAFGTVVTSSIDIVTNEASYNAEEVVEELCAALKPLQGE